MADIPPLHPMDSVFSRLRNLCRAQRDTAEKLCNASKKLEQLADITTDLQAIKDEIQSHDHELANLTTIVGGWRVLSGVDDGISIAPDNTLNIVDR